MQKARLLHSLFYEEMPQFIDYLQKSVDDILENREPITANWKERFFTADLWIRLAEDTAIKLQRYPKDIVESSSVFGEQLFEGYTAIFMVHQLINYGETSASDPKFNQAVDLLFV